MPLELDHIRKTFPGGVRALDGLALAAADGELLVLVGPSGCGKTTTLRVIAGLELPDSGSVRLDGRDLTGLAPRHRDVAMVFQHPALYPHLSVRENLAFGLSLRRTPRAEVRARVDEAADMLGIGDLLDRRPKTLSGGQQQRVALGRAVVRRPRLFLLDEPLASLDGPLRTRMRAEIRRLQAHLGTAMIYVTHDQTEAMTLGHRVAVLDEGRVQQVDEPQTLYRRPANRRVAALIGSPPMNLVEGRLERCDGTLTFVHGRIELAVPGNWAAALESRARGPVVLGVRPEHLGLIAGLGRTQAVVRAVEPLGPESLVHLDTGEQALIARVDPRQTFNAGQAVDVSIAAAGVHLFDAATGAAIRAGEPYSP